MDYTFAHAAPGEVKDAFMLYEKRVKWMNDHDIQQWNVTSYLEVYPVEYYENQCRQGNLYVLKYEDRIVGAVILIQSDDRWLDRMDSSAYYIHNLVTDPAMRGVGKCIMKEVEKQAIRHEKQFIRLDCAKDNAFLNQYYESLGYSLAGSCKDGDYIGNRREKRLAI